MENDEIPEKIREAFLKGTDLETIRQKLASEGYDSDVINRAIKQLQKTGEIPKPKHRGRRIAAVVVLLILVSYGLFVIYEEYGAYKRIMDVLGTTIEVPDAWCDLANGRTAVIPVNNLGSNPLNMSLFTITRENDHIVIPWNTVISPKASAQFRDTRCTTQGQFRLCEYSIALGDRVIFNSIKVRCFGM